MGELTSCLNCGAPLHGAFCAACGQRAVPPHPTVRDLAGDAWHELTGYDGRIMATIRGLARPGFLTREYIEGRRAHYLPPVRVYLIVSVVYFVVAAAAPNIDSRRSANDLTGPGGIRISVDEPAGGPELSDQDRAEMPDDLESAPWFVRPMIRAMEDPEGFRARLFTIVPRVFFALLPIFAAIVAMFYRRRTFPTSLVFAVHVHAFAFLVFMVSEAAKHTRSEIFAGAVAVVAAVTFTVYVLRALRAVFGGRWLTTVAKAFGIGFVYMVVSVAAIIFAVLWASWT